MSETAYRFDPDLVLREMDAVKAWLSRAGLAGKYVPIDAKVVLNDDDTMTVDVYLTRDGRRYLADDRTAARGTLTVPLVYPPSEVLSLVGIPAVPAGESSPEVTG